jgi:hypothetical protein
MVLLYRLNTLKGLAGGETWLGRIRLTVADTVLSGLQNRSEHDSAGFLLRQAD